MEQDRQQGASLNGCWQANLPECRQRSCLLLQTSLKAQAWESMGMKEMGRDSAVEKGALLLSGGTLRSTTQRPKRQLNPEPGLQGSSQFSLALESAVIEATDLQVKDSVRGCNEKGWPIF